jgi:hypothetical protein
MAMLGYTLSTRVAAQRLRYQYMIDYSKARYACDSALKYTLATMEQIQPELISRWDQPDFSDLFLLSTSEYEELIEMWKEESAQFDESETKGFLNAFNNDTDESDSEASNKIENISIPGPYGAPWPLITEPGRFQIGSADVEIRIEDENAKYPIGWGMVEDKDLQREIDAGFLTFCEMSGLDNAEIESLLTELNELKAIKPYKIHFEPVVTTTRTPVKTTRNTSSGKKTTTTTKVNRTVLTVASQVSTQTTSFAKIFNSSLLNKEILARPTIVDGQRKESPLKYISTCPTRLVNINTAPRHVLEAAFIFGGNQVEIADQVIQERQIEPFRDMEDLQQRVIGYSDSLEKSKTYIATESTIFTIKITATSGQAKASCIVAISKNGNKVKTIAVINT